MRVVKTEKIELVSRQLEFFNTTETGPEERCREARDCYSYKFTPGVQCLMGTAISALNPIWSYPALETDETRLRSYLLYVEDLAQRLALDVSVALYVLEFNQEPSCLVHGDACLDNFLWTGEKVVILDPGIPRGFSSKSNDLGKLLQEPLTLWSYIKFGVQPPKQLDVGQLVSSKHPVDSVSIASLVTHWVRILKNAYRHSDSVQLFGSEIVIPTLVGALWEVRRGGYPDRSRWHPRVLQGTYSQMLSGCTEILSTRCGLASGEGRGFSVG